MATHDNTAAVATALITSAHHTSGRASTDLGNAERLIDRYGHLLKFLPAENTWLYYHRGAWRRDTLGIVHLLAAETVRNMGTEVAAGSLDVSHVKKSQSERALRSMVKVASSNIANVAVAPTQLDEDPDVLNVLNGTVDLRTGVLHPHQPDDLLTQQATANYDPKATCEVWNATLNRIFNNDTELISFFQRACGYSASGRTGEQVLLLAWGTGANGKSTTLEAVKAVLGSYAQQAPADLLIDAGKSDSSSLHRLNGVRLLACTETPDGRKLSEETVKQLTGGDTIVARPLYGKWVEFKPVLTPWILTNHRPIVGGSEAIWRRLRMVPFTTIIPAEERDQDLPRKLWEERDGILAWVVEGARKWYAEGLGVPASVSDATGEYRAEQDTLGQFIETCLIPTPGTHVETQQVFAEYDRWADATGEFRVSQKLLSMRLSDRGFDMGKDSRTRRSIVKNYSLASRVTAAGSGMVPVTVAHTTSPAPAVVM